MIDNVVIWRELELKFWREDKRAVMPCVAYEGTSACFDLIAIRNTVIPAGESAMIPNGLRVLIPEGWYIEFATRSGHGIKYDLRVHPGIIDAGYKGPLSVKMYNLGKEDISILKGKLLYNVKYIEYLGLHSLKLRKRNLMKWKQFVEKTDLEAQMK